MSTSLSEPAGSIQKTAGPSIGAVPQDQTALTVYAEIEPDKVDKLRKRFPPPSEAGLNHEDIFPFSKFGSIHFARFVILDATIDLGGNPIEPALLFIADFDGPLDPFLRLLARVGGPFIDNLFGMCRDYPTGEDVSDQSRIDFLMLKRVPENTVYVNWIGQTVLQTQQEAQLHDEIESFIDRSSSKWERLRPTQIRAEIQEFVKSRPDLAWALTPLPARSLPWWLQRIATILALLLAGLLLLPFAIVALPILLILLRRHELSEIPASNVPTTQTLDQLSSLEDHVVQNQFTAGGLVKAGWFRRTALPAILFLVNLGTKFVFNRGNLAGVRTIHFARWLLLNDKRRLLFASNYDGSLESYMDDFIDKVAWGLNAVFSNGLGYPRTNWLFCDGAKDEQAFKNFLHTHQAPTQLWYTAYPRLTTLNIMHNAKIRRGLSGNLNERQASDWLSLL